MYHNLLIHASADGNLGCFHALAIVNSAVINTEVMAIHSRILAWRIPWTEEPGRLQSTGRKELDKTERLTQHYTLDKNFKGSYYDHE